MNLQPRTDTVTVSREFMQTTQGMVFKVGGVTLDNAQFADNAIVLAGTAISIGANGLAKPWADADTGLAFLTTDDVRIGTTNVITGALEAGYVKTNKVTGATAAFRTATQGRIHFR